MNYWHRQARLSQTVSIIAAVIAVASIPAAIFMFSRGHVVFSIVTLMHCVFATMVCQIERQTARVARRKAACTELKAIYDDQHEC